MSILNRGAKGQDVLDLQCGLAAAGVFDGDFDGCFGSATAMAVTAFQKARNLPETGELDPGTMAALQFRFSTPPESRVPSITPAIVAGLFPGARVSDIARNLPFVLNALVEAGLANRSMILMALATIQVETASFLPVSEMASSLNTPPDGKPFGLYDNRAALGNKGAPDGANFRGRGFVQLTGRANYLRCGKELGMGSQLIANPLLAHNCAIAAKLLAQFLKTRQARLQAALSAEDFASARRVINGGSSGLQQFTQSFKTCSLVLPADLVISPATDIA